MNDKILEWFATGERGVSSEAMALAVAGFPSSRWHHNNPSDSGDFGRCVKFLHHVPEARQHMDKVAALSPVWAKLVDEWSSLEASYWAGDLRGVSERIRAIERGAR